MKKKQLRKLQLSKVEIAKISIILSTKLMGGTDPISVPVPMTQAPDKNGICYAIE